MKCVGALSGDQREPLSLQESWPASCTMRSRAKRSGDSDDDRVRAVGEQGGEHLVKPGAVGDGSAPLMAAS